MMAEEKPGEEKTPEEEKPPEGEEKPEGEEEEQRSPEEIPPKEEEEPPIRHPQKEQTKEEKRLAYQVRQLTKKVKELGGEGGFDDSADEEDRVAELRQETEERIAKLEEKQTSEELLQTFLSEYPDYKKYTAKIRKFMNHPAYQRIPIGFIADGIAGQDAFEEGARAEREAAKKAKETKTGGSTHRKVPTGKLPDVWEMSKEEFAKYQDEIRQKGRD